MDSQSEEVLDDGLEPQSVTPETREAQTQEEEEGIDLYKAFLQACASYEEEQVLTALSLQYEVWPDE